MGVPYIFDPGKQTPRLEKEQILLGLRGAAVLVGNDYEFAMMAKKIGKSEAELIASAPLTVITRGEQGSTFYAKGESLQIPVAAPKAVVDPTGAGDAYLAGLMFGLARKFSHPVTGRIAALAASYAIEHRGCQEHRYTPAEFVRRYVEVFGASKEIETLARAA